MIYFCILEFTKITWEISRTDCAEGSCKVNSITISSGDNQKWLGISWEITREDREMLIIYLERIEISKKEK